MSKFTSQQIQDWREYERVRESGKFNMLDPKARQATVLSEDEYRFVIENFDALKAEALANEGNQV